MSVATTSAALTLSADEKAVLRTAAYGAVSLLAAADAAGSPHKVATHGSIALGSGLGPVGHALAEKSKVSGLGGKSVAEMADTVFPALTEAVALLTKKSPAEADNFRSIVTTALEAGIHARKGGATPVMTAMVARIDSALNAA
ncbi:hypothetical protein H9Y04_34370 [Streptomyces sp. TRM66268-LWL]|uniref:D-alanyl-D-alanine carboxypeptidase n=1 Tax=Streptomyces polyasparticus TaxID=2767826 RepID=A0ABR7SQ61_9ACTN|nr:hypothetical protein [Streptomyces polyasparticus]MBC9717630.1 hypothetical protein [Streptomyces polyasparticus]